MDLCVSEINWDDDDDDHDDYSDRLAIITLPIQLNSTQLVSRIGLYNHGGRYSDGLYSDGRYSDKCGLGLVRVKVLFVGIPHWTVSVFPQIWTENIRRNSVHRNTDTEPMITAKEQ